MSFRISKPQQLYHKPVYDSESKTRSFILEEGEEETSTSEHKKNPPKKVNHQSTKTSGMTIANSNICKGNVVDTY